MSKSVMRKASKAGVKCITAALGHWRNDKYLYANKKEYRCISYRNLWRASRTTETFEAWLRSRGISEEEARRLVVRGFLNEVLALIPVPRIQALVHDELDLALEEVPV